MYGKYYMPMADIKDLFYLFCNPFLNVYLATTAEKPRLSCESHLYIKLAGVHTLITSEANLDITCKYLFHRFFDTRQHVLRYPGYLSQ